MKKRMLAMLLVLAMALSLMPPITAAAAPADYREDYDDVIAAANEMTFPTDEVSTKEADCPACGAKNAVWQPLTAEGSYTNGHYYLAKDIVGASAGGLVLMSGSAGTLCLHLNNHTLNDTGRTWPAIRMWSGNCHLNLMGNGTVTCNSGNWGALSVQGGACNVYGGTFSNTGTNYDGAINCRNNTTNIYNAEITEGKLRLSSYSGTDFPTVNVYGGTFSEVRGVNASAKLTVKGGNITALNGGCDVTVAGGTVGTIRTNGLQDYTTFNGKITVAGGTVETLIVDEYATDFNLSGNPVINALDMTASPVLPTVGTLTQGASINLGDRAGVFTTAFASKEAAQAAAPYFTVTTGESILVTEDNCLTTGRDGYLVGYSKVDINPYADGTGKNQALMAIGMAGFGDNTTRLSLAQKLDDNGDGKVDANDGIFATCTAITDKEDNTVLMFTLDMLWGYTDSFCDYVVQTLLEDESYAKYGLAEERIFFNGAHNHFAPQTGADTASDEQAAFNEIMRKQLLKAAQEALADRAWADMYEGSLNVTEYFNTGNNKKQPVGDLLNEMRRAEGNAAIDEVTYESRVGAGTDVLFTASRHFKITVQKALLNANGAPIADPSSGHTWKVDPSAQPVTYYTGNGFNGDWVGVGFLNHVYEYDEETGIVYDGTVDPTTGKLYDEDVPKENRDIRIKEIRVVTGWEEEPPADDTLRVVQFRFGADSGKDPVVMINWRGHLPSSSELSATSYRQVSGGMVNALRNAMAFKGYRASFLQGETGGINMENKFAESDWMKAVPAQKTNIFGTELAQLALTVIEDSEKINEDGGQIKALRQVYQTDYVHSTPFEYLAAMRYKSAYAANGKGAIGKRVYKEGLYYHVDAAGTPLIDTKTGKPKTAEDGTPLTDPANGKPYNVVAVGDPVYATEVITISSWDEADRKDRSYVHKDNVGEYYNEVTLNALTIGDEFTLTSVAAEIFDHYIGENGENLWDTLKAEHDNLYILGVTNGPGGGYMPDKNNYHLAASDNEPTYVVGTYESNGTRYAQGTGEAVVGQLDIMLDFLEKDHAAVATTEGKCEHCGEDATWSDLTQIVADGRLPFERTFTSGHYYLSGQTDLTAISVPEGAEVCIDLNGQNLNVYRNIVIDNGGKLNIVDSKGGSTVMGYEGLKDGGIFTVSNGAKLNIYGGTYRYDTETRRPASGGIVCVSGEFTLYDGTLEGTGVSLAGGAVLVNSTGHAFFRGGKVTSGYITTGSANGNCVTTYGEVTLSGDVTIQNLFYIQAASHTDTQRLHLDGVFTGNVTGDGQITGEVGIASDTADTTLGELNFTYSRRPQIIGGKVVMAANTDYVAQNAETGEFIYGDYKKDANTVDESKLLNTVLETLPDGSRVVMLAKIPDSVSVAVKQNLQWELKGQNVNCSFTVAEDKTLRFTDCKGTGTVNVNNITGKFVFGEQPEDDGVVYIPIEDQNGNTSFHPARLNIDQMVLRAENQDEDGKATPGVYFKHKFGGDQTVIDNVVEYGIAFSLVKNEAFEAALKAEGTLLYENSVVYKSGSVVYTKIDGESFGTADMTSTSTIITGIMKEDYTAATNESNAQTPIYGVAYVKLQNGQVVLGAIRERSLQEQVEKTDEIWEDLNAAQRKSVLKMYKLPTMRSVVDSWNVSNLTDPAKAQADEEKKVLRVLSIGNSHTDDANKFLYNVFQAENAKLPEENRVDVQIAQLYYSGCTIEQHVAFATKNEAVYKYRTLKEWEPDTYSTMRDALRAEVWDVIIIHEMNNANGSTGTYTGNNRRNLQKHINYIKQYSLNGDPKILWNFSWSNPTSQKLWDDEGYPNQGGKYDWVVNYKANYGSDLGENGDLRVMYGRLLADMKKNTKQYVMTNENISDLIPTGLAFNYARESNLNPNQADPDLLLYSDYTHARTSFGHLLASYVWYATLVSQTDLPELAGRQKITKLESLNYKNDQTLATLAQNLSSNEQKLLLDAANYALNPENQ